MDDEKFGQLLNVTLANIELTPQNLSRLLFVENPMIPLLLSLRH